MQRTDDLIELEKGIQVVLIGAIQCRQKIARGMGVGEQGLESADFMTSFDGHLQLLKFTHAQEMELWWGGCRWWYVREREWTLEFPGDGRFVWDSHRWNGCAGVLELRAGQEAVVVKRVIPHDTLMEGNGLWLLAPMSGYTGLPIHGAW